jgi:multidrug efflux pump subunit AcrA (membrane-fusion protein)
MPTDTRPISTITESTFEAKSGMPKNGTTQQPAAGQAEEFDLLNFGTPPTRSRGPVKNDRWKAILAYGLIGMLLVLILAGVLISRFISSAESLAPTETVIRGTFLDSIVVNGSLRPQEQEIVTTALSGPISAIWVAEGDIVDEGQELFEVEVTTNTSRGTQTSYESVTAPIAGTVARLNLSTGKSFLEQNGADSPALVIADLASLLVALDVNEVDIPRIAVGQTAELSFDAIPDLLISATVTRVSLIPNEGSAAAGLAPGGTVVTYPVELALTESDPRLKSGMSVSAKIVIDEIPDALLVNALALQDLDGSSVVYVQEPKGDITAVEVNVIASSPTQIAIEGSLAEGEQVLISAYGDEQKDYGDLFTVRRRFNG